MLKKILLSLLGIAIVAGSLFGWFVSLIPAQSNMQAVMSATAADIPYLNQHKVASRGKILAVVTSTDQMGTSGKSTGYELTELARAYWVFTANGFEVDIASPQGGEPPVVLDDDDMREFDYAFLNDETAQQKVKNSIHVNDVDPAAYQGVYFVGGKGAMYDFPDNPAIQELVKYQYQQDRVVAAVCHGPAALVNVKLDDGSWLVDGRAVSAFTNEEELFLIKDAENIFPFLLEDKLKSRGANYSAGQMYLDKVSSEGKLITGQNPWSVWGLAESMIEELGYTPVPRQLTAEEHSVNLLMLYHQAGYEMALDDLRRHADRPMQRTLILIHGLVAFMQWQPGQGLDLMLLAQEHKDLAGA